MLPVQQHKPITSSQVWYPCNLVLHTIILIVHCKGCGNVLIITARQSSRSSAELQARDGLSIPGSPPHLLWTIARAALAGYESGPLCYILVCSLILSDRAVVHFSCSILTRLKSLCLNKKIMLKPVSVRSLNNYLNYQVNKVEFKELQRQQVMFD